MAQLSQQRDWSHMFQVFQFNVANNFTTPGVRVIWLLCYFVNRIYNKILDRDWFSASLFVT